MLTMSLVSLNCGDKDIPANDPSIVNRSAVQPLNIAGEVENLKDRVSDLEGQCGLNGWDIFTWILIAGAVAFMMKMKKD